MVDSIMDYGAMCSAANQVKAHKEEFDSMISGMTTIVSSLEGQWKGVAKTEFENQFSILKPTLQKFSELLGRYRCELEKEVEKRKGDETTSAQRIRGSLTLD